MSDTACGCSCQPCDCCCTGVQTLTPADECNRPGQPSIRYRVGTHGQFMASMQARLSTMEITYSDASGNKQSIRPLQSFKTRDPGDFSMALLDGWASVGDVLSFYQERIANEGFLRTATERRSVQELANLVGYTPRPGVASTVYLAYTIDDKQLVPVTIPKGSRSQSIPDPGEQPQTFETSEDFEARAEWNALKPRVVRPQTVSDLLKTKQVYLAGTKTQLKPVDPLLIDFGDGNPPAPFQVVRVEPDSANDRTLVTFASWQSGGAGSAVKLAAMAPVGAGGGGDIGAAEVSNLRDPVLNLMQWLALPPSLPPRNEVSLVRNLGGTFLARADIETQIVGQMQLALRADLGGAMSRLPGSASSPIKVFALRARVGPFGNIAQRKITSVTPSLQTEEWGRGDMFDSAAAAGAGEKPDTVFLDGAYDKITPGSWVLVDTSGVDWAGQRFVHQPAQGSVVVGQARVANSAISRNAYGMTGKSTLLQLGDASGDTVNWYEMGPQPVVLNAALPPKAAAFVINLPDLTFQLIRRTAIYGQAEELSLALSPIADDICDGGTGTWVELDGHYADLKSGRWVIVSGERADIVVASPASGQPLKIPGVKASELVMLTNVVQDIATVDGLPASQVLQPTLLPDETTHTFIQFSRDISYCYVRDKLTIYGNVVKATNGETHNEILGNGDGSKALQSFTLKQPPLTFTAAPIPAGAESTLELRVNDVQWHETDSLAWLGPKDHGFVTRTDDADNTMVVFGNGEHGARLPTGMLNVGAKYRGGIGRGGNVRAEQISLLQTRPLGVKGVINPQRASGGADRESRDLARENAPLSVMPLDRLVSVQDYADFTRRFAGIAKASAQKTSDGSRELVYLTIAGADDVPIDKSADLYRNLCDALIQEGDSDLPLQVEVRELLILVLSAKVKILPDYRWESVVQALRSHLLATFGFERRALGQPVMASEVIACMQNVSGVAYVDVDAFGAVPEQTYDPPSKTRHLSTPSDISTQVQTIVGPGELAPHVLPWRGGRDHSQSDLLRPAELAIFTPAVPDTLILNQIP